MTDILPAPRGSRWPSILLARARAKDPTDLDAAISAGAFVGLRAAVADLGPMGTMAEVAASGLRGRGGAGFPTADKWRAAAVIDAPRRYVVANGYGADPAVGSDRLLMARDPFAVVEGLAIAALAIGASEAILAVRAEATEAVEALRSAVGQAEDAGFIGPDALGPGGDLTMRVETVQGAYMLGEETVLLKALEGKRGQPEQRPPYPVERGLFGAPTVVQNVQTLASVAWILANGGRAYAAIGPLDSPGTALVHVRGPRRSGVAEVPLGTPLRSIIALGGELGAARTLKGVLVGGPSGGILPPELLDLPYGFSSLREAGAHVGSGSVIVVDDRSCIVDLARLLTRFCADEACGKTIPCRIGLRRLSEIGDRVATGRPRPTDVALMSDLAHDIAESGLCDHERLATLPHLSGMRYFRSELDDHILRSSCAAGVCHPIAVAAGAGAH
jgi:NADH:ubiquinone oxidoreductase subunit F (NADH-binding)